MNRVEYPKPTVWEGVAIAAGAILIVSTALAGLWVKALNNAFDSERAEAIAKSLVSYDIPGGSRGVMGMNVGGTKTAFVASKTLLPELKNIAELEEASRAEVQLWIARSPVRRATDAEDSPELADESISFFSTSQEELQNKTSRTERQLLCSRQVPVQIISGNLQIIPEGATIPAIFYNASVTSDNVTRNQYEISLLVLGDDGSAKAQQVFNSIECKL